MRRIIGIGHSHLHSVSAALNEYAENHPSEIKYTPICLSAPPYAPTFLTKNGIAVLNPVWVEEMHRSVVGGGVVVFMCLIGSEHWTWSLTPGPEPFDFVDPEHDGESSFVGKLIPYELFLRHARLTFEFFSPVLELACKISPGPIVQVIPPPPVFHLPAALLASPQFHAFAPTVGDYGFSPAAFRLKVWRACARAMADVFAQHGIECITAPAASVDADGYLLPDLSADTVHGNISWGRLLLSRILVG